MAYGSTVHLHAGCDHYELEVTYAGTYDVTLNRGLKQLTPRYSDRGAITGNDFNIFIKSQRFK